MLARGVDHFNDILLYQDVDVYLAHGRLDGKHLAGLADLSELTDRVTVKLALHHLALVLRGRIANLKAHKEAVQLGLRKWERPSYSMGFCVAMTMNGSGVQCVTPSTVT